MKDFSNASFPPDTIEVMTLAMNAALATLPHPVSSKYVQLVAVTILRTAKDGERDPNDPAGLAELLELGGNRDLVGSFRLFGHPQLEPVSQHEKSAPGAAVDRVADVSLDLGDVLGTMTVGVDPHRGDAGGAEVASREEFGAMRLAHARG